MVGWCMILFNAEFKVCSAKEMQLNEILLSAVDDVLKEVLGEESAKLVYMYMKTVLALDRKEIMDKAKVFEAELRKLLDKSAYDIMTKS
jgi:hypothetical protein